VDVTYGASFELMYGLDSATGFTVVLRRTTELLSTLGFQPNAPGLRSERVAASRDRLLDLMNVKFLVATTWNRSAETLASRPDRFRLVFEDGSVRVFENLRVLPRAFLVSAADIEVVPDEASQLVRVRDPAFDPERSVILSERPPPPPAGADPSVHVGAEAIEPGINEVRVRVAAAEPSILVLSQAHYPGWKALVGGREAPLLRADYGFLGVALGAGTHTVRFVYRPESLRIGALVSAAALLAVGAVLFSSRRRRVLPAGAR
jgi:hypothetical protein